MANINDIMAQFNAADVVQHRVDFMFVVQVDKSNLNGDPGSQGLPRTNYQGKGLATAESLKRKIRNYLGAIHQDDPCAKIFYRQGAFLNETIHEAVEASASAEAANKGKPGGNGKKPPRDVKGAVVKALYKEHIDLRLFGGVLATGDLAGASAGQAHGPVQLSMLESTHPVEVLNIQLTRCCGTKRPTKEDAVKPVPSSEDDDTEVEEAVEEVADKNGRTMGARGVVSFGVYVGTGSVHPSRAQVPGLTYGDLTRFFEALARAYEMDASSCRGGVAMVKLVVWIHDHQKDTPPRQNWPGRANKRDLHGMVRVVTREGCACPVGEDDYTVVVKNAEISGIQRHEVDAY
jgi:CRISPR-associated protein Csd2